MPELPAKRFRVAFSFAGEKREFVERVAEVLGRCFGEDKVLYDKFYEAEFAHADLAFDLPGLYKKADLVVAVLCPEYESNEWCALEWRAIFSMVMAGGEEKKRVMLSRYQLVDGKGLYGLSGFVDLDDKLPHELAVRILERLADNEGKARDHYTKLHVEHLVPPPAPVSPALRSLIPHNLPTLQPFFGREEELGKIADALDPASRTWGALIDGPGGMGKTSLAVRAAYAVAPEVFSKIVFVSLKTRELDDDGVRDLSGFILSGIAELFGELARLLDRADILKSAEEQRPRLLLEALAGTRTLIILDNLESLLKQERDTVFTLVKRLPPGCKAILTCRQRIGSGAEELMLEKLDLDAALATLAELATHNPLLAQTSEAERTVLYRETGGKPLLLRWTAGQIGRGHCLTFADAIAYLRSCPEGNDPLEFIFGDLVADFSAAETQALCALTYFTQPAKVRHIAEIVGFEMEPQAAAVGRAVPSLPSGGAVGTQRPTSEAPGGGNHHDLPQTTIEEEINRALRSLVNRSLAVPSDEYQTYILVPMVADFMRQKKPEMVAETGSRLEKRAYALIAENGGDEYESFPVLEAAWPSLAPAMPLFLTRENERLQEVCKALGGFLDFTGRWDERLALSQQAEARAAAAGDHDHAGWRFYETGRVHSKRGQAEAVLACAERAAEHWTLAFPPESSEQAGTREHAYAIRLRGIGWQLNQDYPAAIAAFREVVKLHRSLTPESVDVVLALNNLAEAEHLSGDLHAAEQDYQEALHVSRAISFVEGIAISTGNQADLALDRKDWPRAEALAREALPLSEKVGWNELIASNCCRIAKAMVMQGRDAEGLPYAQRAVAIYTRLDSTYLAQAQKVLAECEAAGDDA